MVLPSPGHENTFSMSTVPAISPPSRSPPTVSADVIAFGNTCRK